MMLLAPGGAAWSDSGTGREVAGGLPATNQELTVLGSPIHR